jgi:hypothetical protein
MSQGVWSVDQIELTRVELDWPRKLHEFGVIAECVPKLAA